MPNPHDKTSHPNASLYPKEARTNRLHSRPHPPVDSCAGDVTGWRWRTQSPVYRRRVKRAVQMVASYRLFVHGSDHITGSTRDAIHRLLDTRTNESDRRVKTDGGAREVLSS